MAIKADDVVKVAKFAHLQLDNEQVAQVCEALNQAEESLRGLIALNTENIVPMINPHDAKQSLREDEAYENKQRALLLNSAPMTEQGLFLVPRVIE